MDLRFCVMRHDEAGFQFTRAQHLDRISLLAGLDDAAHRQQVDILVPDGTWQASSAAQTAPSQAKAPIQPALDWVLFRRRSDLDCGVQAQLDTVTLWAATVANIDAAETDWKELSAGKSRPGIQWQKLGELQFEAGATSLVTPAATVRDWWGAAGAGSMLRGAAYAPATSAADPVALGRASNLVTALSPAVSSPAGVQYAALTAPPPEAIEAGTAGALFLVAWPTTVTVGVWTTVASSPAESARVWGWITGTGTAEPQADWSTAGTAILKVTTPPAVESWSGQPALAQGYTLAGYWPGTLATGSAGVQALLDRLGITRADQGTPLLVTRPPEAAAAGEDGSVFMISISGLQ